MKIRLQDGLPFVSAHIFYQGQQLTLNDVVIDTGSSGTVLSVDEVASIGLRPEMTDSLHHVRGVGGYELVVAKNIDKLVVGDLETGPFEIEVGAMDYGFKIDGILGLDFLLKTRAVIDLSRLDLNSAK